VHRTRDGGKSWDALGEGLPQQDVFMGVYRSGLCTDSGDPTGVYFGTNTGQVYASPDEGDSWQLVTQNLPLILAVTAALV